MAKERSKIEKAMSVLATNKHEGCTIWYATNGRVYGCKSEFDVSDYKAIKIAEDYETASKKGGTE